ncbi:MAG: tRNA pseudouridine(55) synthase TruB [Alphaproteobacteria bacterium]|nr:tRNA pseudouridine(55) synthase TruB [Alphaproteobacteria bacterium]OJV45363.1 MAG: tRNA pseudouridine(55) synthase TruB [Alphaproteobacteria bacterium 43-37]
MWHGWIIIDKPQGISSAGVVAEVRRLTKTKKVGHAGTLDPNATGVLPIALGEATKTVPYILQAHKVYEFSIVWGIETDTDDIVGRQLARSTVIPTAEAIAASLPLFRGKIQQVPPQYSAIKVNGDRCYKLARQGIKVAIPSREVEVYEFEILKGAGEAETWFRVHCAKGTYVRSLARDLAQSLEALGCVNRLRRVQIGKIDVQNAISLDYLKNLGHSLGQGHGFILIPDALDDIPVIHVDQETARGLIKGRAVAVNFDGACQPGQVILCCFRGEALALGMTEGQKLYPKRVFNIIEVDDVD